MSDPIRWLDDHDAGPVLSRITFWILGAFLFVVMVVSGISKVINGPTLFDHVIGAIWPVLMTVWAIRGIISWRRRNAR